LAASFAGAFIFVGWAAVLLLVGQQSFLAAQPDPASGASLKLWQTRLTTGRGLDLAVGRGKVYVTAAAEPLVTALDASNGALAWQTQAGDFAADAAPITGTLSYEAAPQRVLLSVLDPGGTAVLYALDAATGRPAWHASLGQASCPGFAVADDSIYYIRLVAGANRGYELVRGDATTGAEHSQTLLSLPDGLLPAALAVAGNQLYLETGGMGQPVWLLAVDAVTGRPAWSVQAAAGQIEPPIAANGLVYTIVDSRSDGQDLLVAYDAASGAKRWEFPAPHVSEQTARPLLLAGDRLYAIGDRPHTYELEGQPLDARAIAVDATTGVLQWALDPSRVPLGLAVTADRVLLLSAGDLMVLEAPTGILALDFAAGQGDLAGETFTALAGQDGIAYVLGGNQSDIVYAISARAD
jgi:outer membrane protein assembly factor BamB